jgi:predicted phosphodiesterase
VCYGHTHVAAIDRHGDTLVVNPGAIYRASRHTVAIVDLPTVEATIIDL